MSKKTAETKVIMMGSGWTFYPLEISNAITSPAIPFMVKIPGGIRKDLAVIFQGYFPKNATSFAINFKTGPSESDDIAFHYNPRIGQCTALNSFTKGSWETHIEVSDKPFSRRDSFIILIVPNSDGYEVYVNGIQQCTFKHRIPLEKVCAIGVRASVFLNFMGFIDSCSTTSYFKDLKKSTSTTPSVTPVSLEIAHPVRRPALPYVGTIPGGLKQGMAVFVYGTVNKDANSFAVNFKTGQTPDDDIAFHYNPRICQYTALNSFRNKNWEVEESAPDKPFTMGGDFQVIVVIKPEGYEVYANGLKHCTFKHRIPLEKVSTISVNGEVTIQLIGFVENWTSS